MSLYLDGQDQLEVAETSDIHALLLFGNQGLLLQPATPNNTSSNVPRGTFTRIGAFQGFEGLEAAVEAFNGREDPGLIYKVHRHHHLVGF
jgi:hypothetical protein